MEKTIAELSDEEFIGYCEIHCKTERALFNGAQLNRIQRLAFGKLNYEFPENFWRSEHEQMAEACKLARERIKQRELNNVTA